jgi:hypothetical protein
MSLLQALPLRYSYRPFSHVPDPVESGKADMGFKCLPLATKRFTERAPLTFSKTRCARTFFIVTFLKFTSTSAHKISFTATE